MKKIMLSLLVALNIFILHPQADQLDLTSKSAIVIDAQTGQILFEKNKDEKLYPASITKIMTIYLAARKNAPNDVITATESAIRPVPYDTSNIALDYGEKITVEQAMYASMLMSANDACNVLAEYVSGSISDFAKLMNITAKEFGAKNTNFVNANGLVDKDHYTTAHDFALITMNAIKNPDFLKVFSTIEYTIPPTNKKAIERNFVAQHRMVHWAQYSDLNVIGGKSGYTSESQHTLVTYGEKNGIKVIVVTLKNPTFNGVYSDTQKLLEYGYNNFKRTTIDGASLPIKTEGRFSYIPNGQITCLLKNDVNLDQILTDYSEDSVTLTAPDGSYLGSLAVEKVENVPLWEKVLKITGIVLAIIIALLVLFYLSLILRSKKKIRKRRTLR